MTEFREKVFDQASTDRNLYKDIVQSVTKGKRLPYREYLKRRTIHYIEHVATSEEIDDIKTAIQNRFNYWREGSFVT